MNEITVQNIIYLIGVGKISHYHIVVDEIFSPYKIDVDETISLH